MVRAQVTNSAKQKIVAPNPNFFSRNLPLWGNNFALRAWVAPKRPGIRTRRVNREVRRPWPKSVGFVT